MVSRLLSHVTAAAAAAGNGLTIVSTKSTKVRTSIRLGPALLPEVLALPRYFAGASSSTPVDGASSASSLSDSALNSTKINKFILKGLPKVSPAPKRPVPAYSRYLKDNYSEVASNMPSSVAAASKLPWTSRKIAEMWNHEPQHVKDSYSEKYALARKQYEKDYAKYLSSLSVTDHLVLSKERTLRKSLGLKVTKLPENVGRPKKGCTAGLHFIRETLKLPEGSINDLVGGVVGSSLTARVPALWKVWHRMDADAKRPYISAAEKDREVYKRKMEQYTSDHLKTVNAMKSSIVSLGASFKAKLPSAKLASKRLAAKKLASKRLAAAKLASKKLAAKKLAAKRLAAKRLAAAKLASKKLAVKKLAAEKLASKRLAAKTLAAKRLAAAKLASKKLTGKKTATKKTATKKLVSKKPVGVKPSTSKLSAKKAPAKKVVLSKKPASSKKAVSGKTSTAKKATKASVSRK